MKKIINIILFCILILLLIALAYKANFVQDVIKIDADPEHKLTASSKSSDGSADSTVSRKEVETIVKDYINNNPEVVIDAAQKVKQKKEEESTEKAENYIKDKADDITNEGHPPIFGNKDGDIIVVLFYDYNCSYCKQANESLKQIISEDPKVAFIMRPIPVLGPKSSYASKAALALYKIAPDKFFDMHNDMMKLRIINEASIKEVIKNYGIDYSVLENELNSLSIQNLINSNLNLAKNVGLRGAPSQIINGHFIAGMLDAEKYRLIFAEIRNSQPSAEVEKKNAEPEGGPDSGKTETEPAKQEENGESQENQESQKGGVKSEDDEEKPEEGEAKLDSDADSNIRPLA